MLGLQDLNVTWGYIILLLSYFVLAKLTKSAISYVSVCYNESNEGYDYGW